MSTRIRFLVLLAFLLLPSLSFAQQHVTCAAAPGGARVYCQADTRGGVALVRPAVPGLRCRQGIEWGFDAGGIWVEKGCRAEFEVRQYTGGPWWWDSGRGHRPEPWRGTGACFYRNVGYDGPYFCLARGESIAHMPIGFDNAITSVQVVRANRVVIFSKDNFGGYGGQVRDDVPNLKHWRIPETNKSWNNRISSIRVD